MDEKQAFQVLARMIAQQAGLTGQKAAGTPTAGIYPYETGGLFGRCDGASVLVNAMVGPIGIESVLTYVGNDTENEFVDAWTAVEESGSEQATACGDCVTVSQSACMQLYCFGRFCRQTEELQFDKIGLKSNANVPVKTLFGAITDASGNVIVPQGAEISDAFFLETRKVAYALRLKHSTMIWDGTPVNNSGAYEEFKGLETIVNTGKYDQYTEIACPALDSFLMDYAYANPQSAGANAIQNWFRRPVMQFLRRAGGANLDWNTATMYVVMHPNVWDCVARAYACAGLDLCAGVSTSRVMQQSADQARERYEGYLSSMTLPIYGRDYPVILDSQVTQTTGQANGICSDIYFLTTQISGDTVLYGEYQDFDRTYGRVRNELMSMFNSDDIFITDNGRYALVRDNVRGCFDVQVITKPRLVSVTPWLLGRIQNVCCDVLEEPLPDVSGSGGVYELGGGRTSTPVPTLYGECPDVI